MKDYNHNLYWILSLDCLVDSMWPNFNSEMKKNIVEISRKELQSQNKRREKNHTSIKEIISDEIFQRCLARYESRFNSSYLGDPLSVEFNELLMNTSRDLESLNFSVNPNETEELVFLKIKNYLDINYRKISLTDSLMGSLSEATSDWDEAVVEMYSEEYDVSLLESLILRLKGNGNGVDFLYMWRMALEPHEYEFARNIFISELGRRSLKTSYDFDELLMPN